MCIVYNVFYSKIISMVHKYIVYLPDRLGPFIIRIRTGFFTISKLLVLKIVQLDVQKFGNCFPFLILAYGVGVLNYFS